MADRQQYTSTPKLAINGASNGGLLIGACLTQRPDLFGAAIPEVGVLDMLRFQKFTVGWGWVSDYGSSDNALDFPYLYKYSPLHNIKPGTHYPPTLILTADHDDRVFPAHSFKFAATLQAAQGGPAPVLIRIETRAGHGSGEPISKIIDATADKYAFFGVRPRDGCRWREVKGSGRRAHSSPFRKGEAGMGYVVRDYERPRRKFRHESVPSEQKKITKPRLPRSTGFSTQSRAHRRQIVLTCSRRLWRLMRRVTMRSSRQVPSRQ